MASILTECSLSIAPPAEVGSLIRDFGLNRNGPIRQRSGHESADASQARWDRFKQATKFRAERQIDPKVCPAMSDTAT